MKEDPVSISQEKLALGEKSKAIELLSGLFRLSLGKPDSPQHPAPQENIEYWRERILFAVISAGTMLSLLAFVPGVLLALQERLWLPVVLDCGILGCGLILLFAKGISYTLRASVVMGLIYFVGLYVLIYFGLLSGGPIWLFAFGVMSALLLGLKTAILGILINALTLGILGWLYSAGHLGQGLPFFPSPLHAITAGGCFLLLNVVTAVSCALLMQAEKTMSGSLEQEKAQLMEAKKKLEDEISSRKEVERMLRDSESRHRLLAENASDVIWTLNLDTMRFDYISPSVQRAYGFTPDEALEMSVDETLTPLSLESVTHALQEELAKEGKDGTDPYRSRAMEIQQILRDGTWAWAEVTMTFIRNEQGRPIEVLGVTRDIRERKRAEEEKKGLEERLLEARKMEAIANLAGGIAHQFNNALNVITLSLEALELDLRQDQGPKSYLANMKNTVQNMSQLTNQLLAYARGGKYRARVMPMGKVLEKTLPLVRNSVTACIRVNKDIPEDLWSINVDEIQFQMVLSAILSNASEAIEGEGSIWITCGNVELKEEIPGNGSGIPPGPYVCLTVEDNGKGMDEETRRKIFEPFYTTKFRGRGLGMSAVYGIVRNHEGFISIDSSLGRGTSVRIYLPAVEKSPRPENAPAKSVEGTKTILVIEDDKMLIGLLRAAIEQRGYRVLEAATGREALSTAKTFEGIIHLAILDMFLPDSNSKEVFQGLKEARPDMKVLLMSGYSIEGPAQELLGAGAAAFLQKPFGMDALSQKLKQMGV